MQPVQNMVLHYSVDKLFFSVLHVLLVCGRHTAVSVREQPN